MKKDLQKNLVTIKTLKKDVRTYLKLEKAGKNAKAWYKSFAVNNLLENLEITLGYAYQIKKQEFDITILFAMELINKFQSEELARVFIWKYNIFYKDISNEEKMYKDIISLIYKYIENSPNYNRLDFTKEMKEVMRGWKGKTLQSYIENADDGYVTVVRLCIENKTFDIENDYALYVEPDGEDIEFSCFSCVEVANNQPLESSVVGGKNTENTIKERIENIFIVQDLEIDEYPNGEKFEFSYEVALVLQTESRFYVFWRHLIFNTIQISVCKDIKSALESIKELNEDDEEIEGVTIIKKKLIQEL